MANGYYNYSGNFIPGTLARAEAVSAEFSSVATGFSKLSIQGIDTGLTNAYVFTTPGYPVAAYNDGNNVQFKALNSNSGPSTVNVNGIGVVPLLRFNGNPLVGGDISAGAWYTAIYEVAFGGFTIVSPAAYATFAGTISLAVPPNKVGLVAAAGVSTAAAPIDVTFAIDQNIAPTWTGAHKFTGHALQVGSPTGGDNGAGNVNVAGGFYVNGISASALSQFNILSYGADPSGIADSGAAIMAAVNAANAAGGGRVLYPAGTFLVGTGTLVAYTYGNIQHEGNSTESTVIVNGSTNQPAINVGSGSQIYGGGLKNMRFTGKSGVIGVNGQAAFVFNTVGQFRIENVFVSNATAALYRGAYFTGCSQHTIYDLQVQSCTNDGVTNINGVDTYMTDSRSDANGGAGVVLNGSQGGYYKAVTAFNNTGSAWYLASASPSTAPNKNNFFSLCVGDTSGTYNWQIGDSQDSEWAACWGSTQQSTVVNTFATGFVAFTQYCKRLTFADCVTINNNSHGFQVLDTGSSAPTNIMLNNPRATANGVAAGGGYGVTYNGVANHIRVNGGDLTGNATGAISNSSAGSDIAVSGNPIGYTGTQTVLSPLAAAATSGVALTVTGAASNDAIVSTGVSGQFAATLNGANSATGYGLKVVGGFTGAGTTQLVEILDQNNTNGVNILLGGNGGTTPNKYIRVNGGVLQVLNSGYSGNILAITDAGNVTVGATSGVSLTVNGVSGTHSTKIADSANNSFNAGFLEIPQNSKSANYTTVLSDSGKHIYHPSADTTARTWTIDSNANVAYPIGTAITFDNDTSAGVITLAITTDTLVWLPSGVTGSRSIAAGGQATALKVTATRWHLTGVGIT